MKRPQTLGAVTHIHTHTLGLLKKENKGKIVHTCEFT